MASDLAQLCLHGGYCSRSCVTQTGYKVEIYREKIVPDIGGSEEYKEKSYEYQGPVYCLSVPNEVFMVRNNGKCVWTGNSRARGPNATLTRQPLPGRSRAGGKLLPQCYLIVVLV